MRHVAQTAFILLLVSSIAAAAAPFGIEPGSAITSLGDVREVAPGKYYLVKPPKQHPDLVNYSVWASPNSGVCLIKASNAFIENDPCGDKTCEMFDKLRQQLDRNYGQGNKIDFLRPGALWKEAREWMMGLYKEDRILQSIWHVNNAKGDRIKTIILAAQANGSDKAYVSVQYELSNFDACEKEINDSGGGAL